MNIEKLYEQADEIHAAMVEKGFWEDSRPTWKTMMLIEGELYEAIEGIRKGKKADLHRFQANDTMNKSDEHFRAMFDGTLKGSTEMEISDTYIRVLDYIGRVRAVNYWVNKSDNNKLVGFSYYQRAFETRLRELKLNVSWEDVSNNQSLLCFIRMLAKESVPVGLYPTDTALKTARLIHMLDLLVVEMDFDLQLFIKIKSRYNKLRAYKHGKNF